MSTLFLSSCEGVPINFECVFFTNPVVVPRLPPNTISYKDRTMGSARVLFFWDRPVCTSGARILPGGPILRRFVVFRLRRSSTSIRKWVDSAVLGSCWLLRNCYTYVPSIVVVPLSCVSRPGREIAHLTTAQLWNVVTQRGPSSSSLVTSRLVSSQLVHRPRHTWPRRKKRTSFFPRACFDDPCLPEIKIYLEQQKDDQKSPAKLAIQILLVLPPLDVLLERTRSIGD